MKKILKEQETLSPIQQAIQDGCLSKGSAFFDSNNREYYKIPLSNNNIDNTGLIVKGDTGQKRPLYIWSDFIVRTYIDGKPVEVKNEQGIVKLPCKTSSSKTVDDFPLLTKFGVTKYDRDKIDSITTALQKFVNDGAVSDIFKKWNNTISSLGMTTKLTNTPGLPLSSSDLLTKYEWKPEYTKQYGWADDVKIYTLKGKTPTLYSTKVEKSKADCNDILTNYVVAALQYNAGVDTTPMPQIQNYKQQIMQCKGAGAYDNFTGFSSTYLDPSDNSQKDLTVISDKLIPFGLMDKDLKFKKIVDLLWGEKVKGLKLGPSPYRIYLGESTINLKKVIKENLHKAYETKKQTKIEHNIIKKRFDSLAENKTNKQKLLKDIIFEISKLEKQGFSSDSINAGLKSFVEDKFGENKYIKMRNEIVEYYLTNKKLIS